MYERFTDRARKVMQLSNQEAQRHRHEYIGTEHILLGLVRESISCAPNGVTTLLAALGVDIYKIGEIEKYMQDGPDMVTMGKLPQTPRAKKVIELALEFANSRNECVELEHILIGLIKERDGAAAQVLANLGATYEKALGVIPEPQPTKVHASEVRSSSDWTYVGGVDMASGTVNLATGQVSGPESQPACETCRYFIIGKSMPQVGSYGHCHRGHPKLTCHAQGWPFVNGADWCGEYERAAEAVK